MWKINLYTKLISINDRFIFGDYFDDKVECGEVLVNGASPEDINMRLNIGDMLWVLGNEYVI